MIAVSTIALACLSLNIYHESRNQPEEGQIAVAMVTMHRANWKPERVCYEVVKPKQFSWVEDKVVYANGKYKLNSKGVPKEKEAWIKSVRLAKKVMAKKVRDTSKGATHFNTTDIKPKHTLKMKKTVVIGNHVFFKEKEDS